MVCSLCIIFWCRTFSQDVDCSRILFSLHILLENLWQRFIETIYQFWIRLISSNFMIDMEQESLMYLKLLLQSSLASLGLLFRHSHSTSQTFCSHRPLASIAFSDKDFEIFPEKSISDLQWIHNIINRINLDFVSDFDVLIVSI